MSLLGGLFGGKGDSNSAAQNWADNSLNAGDGSLVLKDSQANLGTQVSGNVTVTTLDGGAVAAALGSNEGVSIASIAGMLGATQSALGTAGAANRDSLSFANAANAAALGFANDTLDTMRGTQKDALAVVTQAANENSNLAKEMAALAVNNVAAPGSTANASMVKMLVIGACVIAALFAFFLRRKS